MVTGPKKKFDDILGRLRYTTQHIYCCVAVVLSTCCHCVVVLFCCESVVVVVLWLFVGNLAHRATVSCLSHRHFPEVETVGAIGVSTGSTHNIT